MRVRAPGKVNLCLFLGPVRADGRHELVTLFEKVSLYDELIITPAERDEVVCSGVEGPNLVAEAVAGLRARGWDGPPVRVQIDKRIPVAGGMGGGSADAAATLRVLSEFTPVALHDLVGVATELGADVPAALVVGGFLLGTGAGDAVSPMPPPAPHGLVLVPADHELSTAAVYAEADRLGLPRASGELDARLQEVRAALQPGARLPLEILVNDLEPAARSLWPPIGEALEAVRSAGADHAFVCGSGPTVAGLFWGADGDHRATRAAAALAGRFPRAIAVAPVSSHP